MAHILITSGPTRQYLDPVRYLTNASSGRMGAALALSAIDSGHSVTVVSGPVDVDYPEAVSLIPVVSTQEMLDAALAVLPTCDGVIGVAAPCDYAPMDVSQRKLAKTGEGLTVDFVETPDILAALGREKGDRWMVGFALETHDRLARALQKLKSKRCDLIVVNGPTAIDALETRVELLASDGEVVAELAGGKQDVARGILQAIGERLL